MTKSWYKKGLVLSIIILFYGVSLFSSVSSRNLSTSNEEMLEYDTEVNDNVEIEPVDKYTEIYTSIWVATGEFGELKYTETGEGFFRHVEIWIDSGGISISGIRREFPWFFNEEDYTRHLIVPNCHIYQESRWQYGIYTLSAIAIGNIYKG